LDDNGGELILLQFGEWYMNITKANADLIIERTTQEGRKETGKKS